MTEPRTHLAAALHKLQKAAKPLKRDKTAKITSQRGGSYEYKYATLDTIADAIDPLLTEHKLVWTTMPGGTRTEPVLLYSLIHVESGERIAGEMPLFLPEHPSGQEFGSAITYARRYSKVAVLDLVADDDDDGHAAEGRSSYGKPKAYDPARDSGEKATAPQQKKVRAEAAKAGLKKTPDWEAFTTRELGAVVYVDHLTKAQASFVIDRLMQGAIPTGESDLPEDAPAHEPVPDDGTLPFDATAPH
jgi:hypothetical protein